MPTAVGTISGLQLLNKTAIPQQLIIGSHNAEKIPPKQTTKSKEQLENSDLPKGSSCILKQQKSSASSSRFAQPQTEQWRWKWMESNFNGRGPPRFMQLLQQKNKVSRQNINQSQSSQSLSAIVVAIATSEERALSSSRRNISTSVITENKSKQVKQTKKQPMTGQVSLAACGWSLLFFMLITILVIALLAIFILEQ